MNINLRPDILRCGQGTDWVSWPIAQWTIWNTLMEDSSEGIIRKLICGDYELNDD